MLRRCLLLGAYGAQAPIRNMALAFFLCAAAPLAAESVTVAALGDSLTQGYGLPPEQGLVPQLQDWLEARDVPARLVNAGVSGDTSAGGAARIGWTLDGSIDALIVALGANDALRGIAPELMRENLDTILQTAGQADIPVLLVGIRAPGNYGAEYRTAFEETFPALAEAHDTLLVRDILAPLAETQARDPGAVGRLMQPDGLHPNAAGVARIVETLGPAVADLVARAQR